LEETIKIKLKLEQLIKLLLSVLSRYVVVWFYLWSSSEKRARWCNCHLCFRCHDSG